MDDEESGKRRVVTAGRLAVVFALAPCCIPLAGILLTPIKDIFFAETGARIALVSFMTGCSAMGIISPFLAFRAIMHRRRGEEHASPGEVRRGVAALVVFLLGLLTPFPMFAAGSAFMYLTTPRDHRFQAGPPEERHFREIYGHLREAAMKHPETLFPRLSATPGRLMHEFSDVYQPNWGESPSPYIARRDPNWRRFEYSRGLNFEESVDDWSFFYLGYEVTNDAEMGAFAKAYRAAIASGQGFGKDLETARENDGGTLCLHRLGLRPTALPSGAKRPPLPKPLAGNVPVLIERIRNNKGKGGSVLFMDGHVEFVDYPGKWPMTERTVALLNELDQMGKDAPGAH